MIIKQNYYILIIIILFISIILSTCFSVDKENFVHVIIDDENNFSINNSTGNYNSNPNSTTNNYNNRNMDTNNYNNRNMDTNNYNNTNTNNRNINTNNINTNNNDSNYYTYIEVPHSKKVSDIYNGDLYDFLTEESLANYPIHTLIYIDRRGNDLILKESFDYYFELDESKENYIVKYENYTKKPNKIINNLGGKFFTFNRKNFDNDTKLITLEEYIKLIPIRN